MKLYKAISFMCILGCVSNVGYGAQMTPQIQRLMEEKEKKLAELEKCDSKRKGFMIAGISTLGLTAVGIGGNIALANKNKKLNTELDAQKQSLAEQQSKLDDVNRSLKQQRLQQAHEDCDTREGYYWNGLDCQPNPQEPVVIPNNQSKPKNATETNQGKKPEQKQEQKPEQEQKQEQKPEQKTNKPIDPAKIAEADKVAFVVKDTNGNIVRNITMFCAHTTSKGTETANINGDLMGEKYTIHVLPDEAKCDISSYGYKSKTVTMGEIKNTGVIILEPSGAKKQESAPGEEKRKGTLVEDSTILPRKTITNVPGAESATKLERRASEDPTKGIRVDSNVVVKTLKNNANDPHGVTKKDFCVARGNLSVHGTIKPSDCTDIVDFWERIDLAAGYGYWCKKFGGKWTAEARGENYYHSCKDVPKESDWECKEIQSPEAKSVSAVPELNPITKLNARETKPDWSVFQGKDNTYNMEKEEFCNNLTPQGYYGFVESNKNSAGFIEDQKKAVAVRYWCNKLGGKWFNSDDYATTGSLGYSCTNLPSAACKPKDAVLYKTPMILGNEGYDLHTLDLYDLHTLDLVVPEKKEETPKVSLSESCKGSGGYIWFGKCKCGDDMIPWPDNTGCECKEGKYDKNTKRCVVDKKPTTSKSESESVNDLLDKELANIDRFL